MNRYFLDVVEQVALEAPQLVLDGEMVVTVDGVQEFDLLSQRIHPAASRVERLAKETPAALVAFDLLAEGTSRLLPCRTRSAASVCQACGKAGGAHRVDTRPRRGGQVARRHREGVIAKEAGHLPAGRAHRHGQDQAGPDRRRRGGRLPLRQGGGHGAR